MQASRAVRRRRIINAVNQQVGSLTVFKSQGPGSDAPALFVVGQSQGTQASSREEMQMVNVVALQREEMV